jgi:glyoxylase-like metal-dependent hydrolase (beta-lactamase superfamily II)
MSLKIIPLSEGVFTIGHDKRFVSFDEATDLIHHRPVGSLLVEIQPFLVQCEGKNILFDTGLGFSLPNGELQIHFNLLKYGIKSVDIDMVILSHLHKDHGGGICHINELGVKELSFPNATYYIGKKEFEYGMEHGFPSYTTEDFDILKNSPQVEWLMEEGNIQHFISYEVDGGHCPFHTSFLIKNGEDSAFFGGDVTPQMKQIKSKYIAKYDFDGRRAMELRQQYAAKGKEEDWTFLFYHDVNMPFSKL